MFVVWWWDQISKLSPHYGYFPNASKHGLLSRILTWTMLDHCLLTLVLMLLWREGHILVQLPDLLPIYNSMCFKQDHHLAGFRSFPHLLPPNHMQLMLHLLMDSLASGCSLLELFLILTIFFNQLKTALEIFLFLL